VHLPRIFRGSKIQHEVTNKVRLWLSSFQPSLYFLVVFGLGAPLSAATYYVDYSAGRNDNSGTSPAAAWKHCPGDPAASIVPGAVVLGPGDKVVFKGGVTYVFTGATGIVLRSSGYSGSPITLDGNSDGTWGSGRAKFTNHYGAAGLTAFSTASALSHLHFKNLEVVGIGGSLSLPPDPGSPVPARFGGGISLSAGTTNVLIEDCAFRDLGYAFNQKPMSASSLSGSAITLRTADSVTVARCDFSRLTLGVNASAATKLANVLITKCTFHDSVVWPLEVPPGVASGVTVYGCSVVNNAQFDRASWSGYGLSPRTFTRTVTAGETTTLRATAMATPSATFQWFRNGTPLAFATDPLLTFPAVATADAGSYTLVARNSAGSTASNELILNVTGGETSPTAGAPVFSVHPVSQTGALGSSVTFTVAVSGSPTPSIRWYRNGLTWDSWTGDTRTLKSLTSNDVGTYVAVATNSAGSATSNPATLTLTSETTTAVAPTFTVHPVSQTSAEGSSVTFTVAVSGSPTPSIRWYRNGLTWDSWTGDTRTLKSLTSNDAGTYIAVATNSAGSASSNGATLTVTSETAVAPTFSLHPVSQTGALGSSVTFTVAVSGSPTPSIRWYRNGLTWDSWTGATRTLKSLTSNDGGTYIAVATNSAGSVSSKGATLTVTP
jgi:hypothetical protein